MRSNKDQWDQIKINEIKERSLRSNKDQWDQRKINEIKERLNRSGVFNCNKNF